MIDNTVPAQEGAANWCALACRAGSLVQRLTPTLHALRHALRREAGCPQEACTGCFKKSESKRGGSECMLLRATVRAYMQRQLCTGACGCVESMPRLQADYSVQDSRKLPNQKLMVVFLVLG